MTGKERVQTTLSHKKADRLPVDFVFEDYRTMLRFTDYLGVDYDGLLKYLECDIVYCTVMDEVQKFVYNPALMDFVLNNGFASKDDVDAHVVYDRWGIGWRTDHDGECPVGNIVIADIEKAGAYKAPDPGKEGQLHELDEFEKKYNGKGYALGVSQYYGLFEKAHLLLGYEELLFNQYDYPGEVCGVLDKIMDYRVELSKILVRHNIAFGHSGDDYGTQRGPVMSIDMWRAFYKPRLKKVWSVYKDAGLAVVHHSCGDCTIFLDDMLEIGLDAIHPVQSASMDIDYLGKRYGNNLVFYGGIDCQQVLTHGSPADVKANVKECVEKLGKYGNMILAPINIMRDVSYENFDALVEAVRTYREL